MNKKLLFKTKVVHMYHRWTIRSINVFCYSHDRLPRW